MSTIDSDKINSLKLELEEQRRDLDVLQDMYSAVKIKNITFLAAALALLGYLFASDSNSSTNSAPGLKEKLFIPDEPYGVIIYCFSLAIFLLSIGVLLFALKPRPWSTPYDDEQEECVKENYEKYLKYIIRRHKRTANINGKSYVKVQSLLDISFKPLVFGGIMLLILKTFGG